ncbi:NAD(P)H-dependent flavin oxidoreductase [Agitococcus lubricus]|uniref:Enoyl-[acyl-carrier protein] reductase II n=1 Tax=Agitococcus lubricus TaxID=1077255 RepID=A0A2T5J223_9GAMM|nr:nitronate monooxygenase [Agitococcus lubricus]PTQ90393.1 enoyl-[acyl-carrier protein] reductase II [Agitococcus lubricus]
MRTAITQLFDIDYPVILPGMSWISTPELVAAVSNAGGLGILALGPLNPQQTRESIQRVRELTDKPFGVNCALIMPGAKENAEIALELKVPVINFSLGKGDWLIERCHAYGGKVIATVTTAKHALAAQQQGVDAVMTTGHEAAAHGGEVTSLVLVPTIVDVLDIPVIACGGFADHRGLLAALTLGAQGVAMGSRFATVKESPLHENIKQQVIAKDQHDTIYSPHFDGLPARYMKTPTAEKLTRKPMNFFLAAWQALFAALSLKVPLWKVFAGLLVEPQKIRLLANFGAATPRLKAATEQGDLERGMQFIGQSQGLINDVCTAEEMMQRLVKPLGSTWQQVAQQLEQSAVALQKAS